MPISHAHLGKPLVRTLPYREPVAVASVFAGQVGTAFFDSALELPRLGRYSFLAIEPFRIVTSRGHVVRSGEETFKDDPFSFLQRQWARYPQTRLPEVPGFQGGMAGCFGYDLGRHLERLPETVEDVMGFPDLALGFYDLVFGFDIVERKAWLVSSGYPEANPAKRQARATARADFATERYEAAPITLPPPTPIDTPTQVTSNFSRPDYERAVQRVIDYIYAGDIFQANLSQCFTAELPEEISPFRLYHRLRSINPAPFAAFLDFGEVVLASSSPERFLRVVEGLVETRPIKGTRPRGRCPEEDRALAAELRASEKDRAENVMIVDLLRNDLSRVCRDTSVAVPELCACEAFATVHHLVSTITGELRPGASAIDLLMASFPGGSITGAPKIRAMEIIDELEPTRRGPYCGSIGYIGFDGIMDSNIVIRTYALRGQQVTFQAGGGIVADSQPAAEYEETLAKAKALIAALSSGAEFSG